ncbi:MAG: radical SAM protein [Nitrospiraceae bacterium]|nr:radical SAM protein [Nitrospiraceae bacterium]
MGGKKQKLLRKADALLSKEKGTVFKEPGGKLNICLVYPNTYHVGMSNLGFQGVYGYLNGMADVLCERAFLPDPEDLEDFIKGGEELFSLESKRPLKRFDMVAFSVSFENDYPHIPRILELANIPPLSGNRGPREPLLLLGGVTAFSNPEPLADFFDVVFIGEAEALLPQFLDSVRNFSVSGGRAETENAFLEKIASVPGIYVPSFYGVSYRRDGSIMERSSIKESPQAPVSIKKQISGEFGMRHTITTPDTEFSNMRLIELMRGCPWSCSFCLAGQVYNPPRQRQLEDVKKEISEALSAGQRVGLIGPSVSDYPGLAELLQIEGVDFSITSLRAGEKSMRLLPYLRAHKSLSIAAEAGTPRLRGLINKKITEEEILETSNAILAYGMNLRVYFIAGLPTEQDEDIEALINLVGKIRSASPRGKITLTVSTFVPKPFTCFQWHPMEDPDVVKKRLGKIKKALNAIKGVSVFHDVPKYASMQGVFAMGDRRLSSVLLAMAREKTDYKTALKNAGLSEDFYIFRQKGADEILPWDFIDTGASREALRAQYERSVLGGQP